MPTLDGTTADRTPKLYDGMRPAVPAAPGLAKWAPSMGISLVGLHSPGHPSSQVTLNLRNALIFLHLGQNKLFTPVKLICRNM